jgi:hypothetical protein
MMPVLMCLCLSVGLLFSGCSRFLAPAAHEKSRSFESRCKPPSIHRDVSLTALEGSVGESGVVTKELPDPEGFSSRALNAAYAIQAVLLLKELHALQEKATRIN